VVTEPPKPGASELDLERVHRDAGWLFSLAILSEACGALGEERGVARLCGLLLPFASVYTWHRSRRPSVAGPRQAARDGAPRARHAAGSTPIDASAQFDATRGA
jgi:hypothetical protein